jgi:hypothetical protein
VYYYKILNDLENRKVTYQLYKFNFQTKTEELVQQDTEEAKFPVVFVAFAR